MRQRKEFRRLLSGVLSMMLTLVMLVAPINVERVFAEETDTSIASQISCMTTEEKVAQMIVPEFKKTWDSEGQQSQKMTILSEETKALLEKYSFGGVILFKDNFESSSQTIQLVNDMQKANALGKNRTQLFVFTDQEGGSVSRFDFGTSFCGNMGLAAMDNMALAGEAMNAIGEECSALGINCNFAPVLDVNNNPSNPVINIRSFSDDPSIVSEYGNLYIEKMWDNGVIPSAKHFPGHGNTETDSHYGLPVIYSNKASLYEMELVPFKSSIENGLDVIMTAHIQYPNIETTQVKSKSGEDIYLPATLSKSIITDLLRGEMGYEGLVVTDSMQMDALVKNFDLIEMSRLAIMAGDDFLLMPIISGNASSASEMETYIQQMVDLAEKDPDLMQKINEANVRILKSKEKYGLLSTYQAPSQSELAQKITYAEEIVGGEAHKTLEWEVANRSLVLLKNENNILPLKDNNESILFYLPYDNEVDSANYGLIRAEADNLIAEGTSCSVLSYEKASVEEVVQNVQGKNHVVIFSEAYNEKNFNPETSEAAKKIDAIIQTVHANGGDCIFISNHLPYDVSRYQNADALMLCWDYRTVDKMETGYRFRGQGMTAATYTLFADVENGPTGKLPLMIPNMGEDYRLDPNTVLFERGYGLNYEKKTQPVDPQPQVHEKTVDTGLQNSTSSNLPLIIGLIVLAVILIVVVIVLRKRNHKDE